MQEQQQPTSIAELKTESRSDRFAAQTFARYTSEDDGDATRIRELSLGAGKRFSVS